MALDQLTAAALIAAPERYPPRTASAMPPVPWQPAFPYTSIGAGPVADRAAFVVEMDLGRRWIAVRGELDFAATGQLGAAMILLLDACPGDSTVDLRDLRFIDAGGIGALVGFATRLAARGATLIIVGVPDNVRRVFDLVGLGAMLEAAA